MANDWYTVNEISDGVFVIEENAHWERVRSYLFTGTDAAWLIDTGTGIGNFSERVRQITDRDVRVLTTHAHWDHIGAHDRFDRVYVHREDADWLSNGLPLSAQMIRESIAKEPFAVPRDSIFNLDRYVPPCVATPIPLEDGDLIGCHDFSFRVIHTPGHSPGSVCYYEESTGLLATGDTVYQGTIYANYPSTDPEDLLTSYRRLAALGKVSKILPGHGKSPLHPSCIGAALEVLTAIRDRGELCHGSGLHQAQDISFLF